MTADELERRHKSLVNEAIANGNNVAGLHVSAQSFGVLAWDAIAALREAERERDGWADQWREESEAHTATFTRMQALTRQMEKWRALAARRRDQSHHRAERADAEIRRRVKAEAERDALALRVEEMEAEGYVRHLPSCRLERPMVHPTLRRCDCGLSALLAPPTTTTEGDAA